MATYPLDVLRCRAAVVEGPHFSLRQYALDLVRQQGLRPLYRGIVPSSIGVCACVWGGGGGMTPARRD